MSGAPGWCDAENRSTGAEKSIIHALIRLVSGEENCIVAAKSSVGGVNDCIGEADAPVGRTAVRHRGALLRAGSFCVDPTGCVDCRGVRPGYSPPAGDLLLCFAKEVSKKGDPASPVGLRPTPLRCSQQAAGVANSPFGLTQRPRKAPPAAALLGGSDGLFGIAEPLRRRSLRLNAQEALGNGQEARLGLNPNNGLSKGSAIPEIPFQTACCEPRREVVRESGRPGWPGRLLCQLSWRRKKAGRPPGRVPANSWQPKALPVGRTSVRHPSLGMAWRVGLKSDPQISGPACRGATMGATP